MKSEIVLKDETRRSESTQLLGKNRKVQTALLLMTQQDQSQKDDKQPTCTKVKGNYNATQHIKSEHGTS